ncbi:hypothetical protein ACODUL_13100 [Stenotrophomonas maltophilia]
MLDWEKSAEQGLGSTGCVPSACPARLYRKPAPVADRMDDWFSAASVMGRSSAC